MADQAEHCRIVDDKVDPAEVGRGELKKGLTLVCDDSLVNHLEVAATSIIVSCEPLADSDVGQGFAVELVEVEGAIGVAHDDFEESKCADEFVSACQLATCFKSQKGDCLD